MTQYTKRNMPSYWTKGNITSGITEVTSYRNVPSKSGRSSENRPVGLFHAIENTILMLSSLPEDDENFVCKEAVDKAIRVLSVLRHANVPPPRIYPEDGDAISFTWDSLDLKRFLTVALDEVDVTHVYRPTRERARKTVFVGNEIDPKGVFSAIGALPRNKSLSVEE